MDKFLDWIVELQSLAQAGLRYSKDVYDLERFTRIRKLSALMLSALSDTPLQKVEDIFCSEVGYQTPKIDTRAAVFENGKILLVKERDGRWALPGGFVDVNTSVGESAVKEVLEEAGLVVEIEKVIGLLDRERHNKPVYCYKMCTIYVQCKKLSGAFQENSETIDSGWFSPDEIPENLATQKTTGEQIALCFKAYEAGENWKTFIE